MLFQYLLSTRVRVVRGKMKGNDRCSDEDGWQGTTVLFESRFDLSGRGRLHSCGKVARYTECLVHLGYFVVEGRRRHMITWIFGFFGDTNFYARNLNTFEYSYSTLLYQEKFLNRYFQY